MKVAMRQVMCASCKRGFWRTNGRVNEGKKFGWAFYCSRACLSIGRTTRQALVCENAFCRKQFTKMLSHISPHNYCSRPCAAQVNNRKYPKRKAEYKMCRNSSCVKSFKGENEKYCSLKCRTKEQQRFDQLSIIHLLQQKAKLFGRTPARRESVEIENAAVYHFGSWNNAIIGAGLTPHRSHDHQMYKRVITKAKDGHSCDSISEAIIDNWLSDHGIIHQRDVSYPTTNHRADWSVGDGTFVEYFGLAKDSPRYDRDVQTKRALCRQHRIRLVALYPSDLYPRSRLDQKLRRFTVDAHI